MANGGDRLEREKRSPSPRSSGTNRERFSSSESSLPEVEVLTFASGPEESFGRPFRRVKSSRRCGSVNPGETWKLGERAKKTPAREIRQERAISSVARPAGTGFHWPAPPRP